MSSSERELVANRFRSLFVIGRGGMGSVEVALEKGDRGFERIVALKRMLPEACLSQKHIDMFMREARVAALLTHPNVVHAFSFGEDNGELFLAMEYVEGEPLSHVLTTAREASEGGAGAAIPAPLVAYILAEICEGLHAAHELHDVNFTPLNLVHRDLSPHNVMVAYEGHVKLLDFGVVKIEELGAKGAALTRTGEVKGKTAYMSPEQAMGEPLDRRSDLYSLGAMLFECVAGRRMWGDGTDFEVLRKLALEEPPPLASVAPDAPPALCDLQRRLVARDREERPATARAVGEELRKFIGASGGTEPDARVLRGLMQRLFDKEIGRRREALIQGLDAAAPAGGDELRKSLLPSGYSETVMEAAAPHGSARPVVVRARGAVVVTSPPPATVLTGTRTIDLHPRSGRPVALAVGASALLVLGGVAFLGFRPPPAASGPVTDPTSVAIKEAASVVADPPRASSGLANTTPVPAAPPHATASATAARAAPLPTVSRVERPSTSTKPADAPHQQRPDAGGLDEKPF